MAEIHLPHASLFSYDDAPAAGYQHRGLAQQVLAHRGAKLSHQLDVLLKRYQTQVDAIIELRERALRLDKKIKGLAKNSQLRAKLSVDVAELRYQSKRHEKTLRSSKISIEISSLKRELNAILQDLNLSN